MYEKITFASKDDFRNWLQKNHASADGAWLIFGKTESLITLSYDDALKEALCFGWIDGQVKSIDEVRYMRKFTPRRKKSVWSDRNKKIVQGLIAQGLMEQPGHEAIMRAKEEGMWDSQRSGPITDKQVQILIDALADVQPALGNFMNMSSSVKRTYAAFYQDAKKEETRIRRLNKIIERLNQNLKPM